MPATPANVVTVPVVVMMPMVERVTPLTRSRSAPRKDRQSQRRREQRERDVSSGSHGAPDRGLRVWFHEHTEVPSATADRSCCNLILD